MANPAPASASASAAATEPQEELRDFMDLQGAEEQGTAPAASTLTVAPGASMGDGFFPSEAEFRALNTYEMLRIECDVEEQTWTEFQGLVGRMGNKFRNLALTQPHVLVEATKQVRIRKSESNPLGYKLSPLEASQVGLMWRIMRRLAWVAGWGHLGLLRRHRPVWR